MSRPATEVNMADVAERAGVSIATVSRALRDVGGVSAHTRDRVREVAAELSYVVSPEASGLARGTKGRVAVVVPRIDVWFYSTMLAGLEGELRAAGLDVLVYQVDGEVQRTRFFAELPARRKVDALVLVALPMLPTEIERLRMLGVHVVVAGGRVLDFPRVEVDDTEITRLAVEHLLDLGHTRVAMIRTSDTTGTSWSADVLRTRTWHECLLARGIDPPDELLASEPYAADAGARAVERLLDLPDPPTAVFAFSDEIAVSALSALQRRGVRVPGDLSLVGVDGHPTAELFGITTVVQHVARQGRLAAGQVLALLRGEPLERPRQQVAVRLVERGSTGPPG